MTYSKKPDGWIARDNDGELYLYTIKPERFHKIWTCNSSDRYCQLPKRRFPKITWDSKPLPIRFIEIVQ